MIGRLVFLVGVLILGASVARAESSPDENPLGCRAASGEPLAALEKRRRSLEQEIAVKIGATRAKSGSDRDLRKQQEDLLEVLFQIDCLDAKPKAQPAPEAPTKGSRAPRALSAAKPTGTIEVTTYFATNRKQTTSTEPDKVYGSEVGSLQYGRALVTIPPTHTPGHLELPTLWKLQRDVDPTKHFVLTQVMPLHADTGRREMAEKLQGMDSKALLIFVHGYNTGFTEAALRTAQMAHDLRFPGMAFFYSWPSANQIRSYWQDEEVARLSESVFEQLIEDLSRLPVTEIYLVAHSMGNRIVGHALQARADKGKETKNIREILLAAPDINADVFRTVIAPKLAAMKGTRTTVYASSSDIALKASTFVHGFRRVGETTGGVVTYPGLETIDASNATAAIRGYGHFYLVDSPSVLKDIRSIIDRMGPPKLRGLSEVGASPDNYWRLP